MIRAPLHCSAVLYISQRSASAVWVINQSWWRPKVEVLTKCFYNSVEVQVSWEILENNIIIVYCQNYSNLLGLVIWRLLFAWNEYTKDFELTHFYVRSRPALSNLWDIEHFCSKKNRPFTKFSWLWIPSSDEFHLQWMRQLLLAACLSMLFVWC